ncbi:type II toxin-antitoxin system RelE/ParE family toxin [Phenylobacterium aquaticum]|uniref:type II toxin-antitoxin system RelE/ParE family toxin n=1 Tax=Phenylobacterium aquaticum TaxID=1763816 RepID=UPI0026EDD5E9|nr:type II toxin-antitoxin system RelE/ParE family toxin [Phenylobacterium aquaticum]
MQTVAETAAYLASAKAEGMTPEEMRRVVDSLAAAPSAGDLIVGSGGCRKLRVAGKGRGKSGGYRVVTIFGGEDMPVYLLAVLAKGSRATFTPAEISAMAVVAKRLVGAHRPPLRP